MIYDLIAQVYDKINEEIDYVSWADFVERLIKDHYKGEGPFLLLDLGCGTGSMTIELARRGYDMTGVDYSVEMLDVARGRAEAAGVADRTLWLCQDMREFELYGTVEVALSCLDSINHLTTPADVKKCFDLVHNYLVPDGLFIFDVNGKARFEDDYADRSYVMEEEGSMCVWQNYYNPRSKLCDFYITLFAEGDDGRYERYDEEQRERMYPLRTIKKLLAESSLEFIGAYSDFEKTPATDGDRRIYIVAKCIK